MRQTAMMATILALGALLGGCAGQTGPAASGAGSSAPNAVGQATSGAVGGGASGTGGTEQK